jgi:hypothetical protein
MIQDSQMSNERPDFRKKLFREILEYAHILSGNEKLEDRTMTLNCLSATYAMYETV